MLEKLDRVEYLLKHMPGRHDQQRHAGSRARTSSGMDPEFASSSVGKTLDALADEYDFVVFGSAALRLHAGAKFGRLPNDIDVIDMHQKAEDTSDRFENLGDPRAVMNPHWVDNETGTKVSAYDAGQVMDTISGMRAPTPRYDYGTGRYKIDKIGKFDVLPLEDVIRDKMWGRDEDLGDVERVIISMDLPRDYIADDARYGRLWDYAHEQ